MSFPGLLRLVRWPGALTAVSNAAVGFLIVHQRPQSAGGAAALAGVAAGAALVYAGGTALNDVADAERDAALHPARPIPSGGTSRDAAWRFGLALLVAGGATSFVLAGPWAGAATAFAALAAFVYDAGTKRIGVVGALVLGLARAANGAAGVLAAAAAPEAIPDETRPLALLYVAVLLAYTALLTIASTFEEGAPSRPRAALLAGALFVAAALPWCVFPATWRAGPAFPLAILGFVLADAVAAADAGTLVRAGVFGFLLVDAAWMFGIGRYETGFGWLVGYVLLRLVLARSRS